MSLLATILALLLPAAHAVSVSPLPDTPNLALERPVAGETDYVDRLNSNALTLDAAVCDKRTGCVISGDLEATGSFIGDGSFLTGIPSQVGFVQEDLTSFANGTNTVFTISTTPLTGSLSVVMDGLTQRLGTDYTHTNVTVTMTVAPASNTSSFLVFYSTGAAGGGGSGSGGVVNADAPILGTGTLGDHLRLDTSSVTMLGPTITPAEVPLLATQVQVAQIGVATAALNAQIAALPNSGFADSPILGNGSSGNHFRLDSSSATLLGPSIGASEVTFNYAGSASQAGPATTALALNADPADCAAGAFSNTIAASGNLGCSTDGTSLTGIDRSSFTAIPQTNFTNTAFGVAFATVTLTTRGGFVEVILNSVVSNGTNDADMAASLLIDGAPPSVFGGISKVVAGTTGQNPDLQSLSFVFPAGVLSAGSHTFSVLMRTEAGTATVYNDATAYSSFGVREIQ